MPHLDRAKGDALWEDPLPSILIDADAEVFAPMLISEIPSHAPNLVSEKSTGRSWRRVPQEKSTDEKSQSMADVLYFATSSTNGLHLFLGADYDSENVLIFHVEKIWQKEDARR